MLTAIKNSLKNIAEIFFIMIFSTLFFAIVGIHLFKGLHNNRCMKPEVGVY